MCEQCGCGDVHHHADINHEHNHVHTHATHLRTQEKGHIHLNKPVTKQVEIQQQVLKYNDELAELNRTFFTQKNIYTLNLISSPGSGKTSLLELCAHRFGKQMAVIEGDIQTAQDSERIIRAGSQAFQIETHGACHLDAHSIMHALEHLDLSNIKLLVIENVGNLVCPSVYDLGEHEKIAILSTPEGDDKVTKYPALFHRCSTLIINKIDLSQHVRFDTAKAITECRNLNAAVSVFEVSALTGQGFDHFAQYLQKKAGLS